MPGVIWFHLSLVKLTSSNLCCISKDFMKYIYIDIDIDIYRYIYIYIKHKKRIENETSYDLVMYIKVHDVLMVFD